jgi:hypothetical protein
MKMIGIVVGLIGVLGTAASAHAGGPSDIVIVDGVKIGMPVESLPGFVCDKPQPGPDRSDRHCVKFTDSRCAGKAAKVGSLRSNQEAPLGCFLDGRATYLDGKLMQSHGDYNAERWKKPLLHIAVSGTRSVPSKVYEVEYWVEEEPLTDDSKLYRALASKYGTPSDKRSDVRWRVDTVEVKAEYLEHQYSSVLVGDRKFEDAERNKQEAADAQARQSGAPLASEVRAKPAGALSDLMEEQVDEVKKRCGIDLEVRTDLAGYSEAEWKAANPHHGGHVYTPDEICAQVAHALSDLCDERYDHKRPWKPALVKELKTLSCVVRHPQKIQDRAESFDQFTKRHMSYAHGVFTAELNPGFANVDPSAATVLARVLVKSPLAPKGAKADPDRHRDNGDPCTQNSQCASWVCSKGFCHACGPGYACVSTSVCMGSESLPGSRTCYDKAALAREAAKNNACRSRNLLVGGAECHSNRDCCSGVCDWFVNRATCTYNY